MTGKGMAADSMGFRFARSLRLPAAVVLGAGLLSAAPGSAPAQEASQDLAVEPVTVTATRMTQGRPTSAIPGSVTVITEEEIEEQTRTTSDLGQILSTLVPGMGQSSQNMTNFGQNLRGRDLLVLIDGVPQTAQLRQVDKHLRSIAPEAIERIEVIRGGNATYGFGATGGIVNFITKSGQGVDGDELQTSFGLTGQPEDSDESFGFRLYQGLRGSKGDFDYSVNASARTTGLFHDGDGDVIPPNGFSGQGAGLAQSREFNIQTKMGYQLTPDQRMRLSLNYYDQRQDARYRADRTTGDTATGAPTQAVPGGPPGQNPGTENLNLSLDYTHSDFLGGTLSSQAYYQDYETEFSFTASFLPPGQSGLRSEKTGFRLAHDRPVFGLANAVYGVDISREETAQPILDGRTSIAELDQTSYGPFLQLEVPLGANWMVKGGVRHERIGVDVPTFRSEGLIGDPNTDPGTIRGGELDYDQTVFNAGIIHNLTDRQDVFFGFSQGFSVADVGRVLRTLSDPDVRNGVDGVDISAEAVDPEAQVVNNFELGWRARFSNWRASLTAFMSTSDLGTSFGSPPEVELLRRKERVYGVEATGDWQINPAWRLGGNASWQEGRVDTDGDGDLDSYLPGTRIAPPEANLYTEYSPTERWSARAQVKHVFDRNRFDGPFGSGPLGEGNVSGYTILDLSGEVAAGPGRFRLGIANVTDRKFITPLGQSFNFSNFPGSASVVAGRGRTYTLEYSVTY